MKRKMKSTPEMRAKWRENARIQRERIKASETTGVTRVARRPRVARVARGTRVARTISPDMNSHREAITYLMQVGDAIHEDVRNGKILDKKELLTLLAISDLTENRQSG